MARDVFQNGWANYGDNADVRECGPLKQTKAGELIVTRRVIVSSGREILRFGPRPRGHEYFVNSFGSHSHTVDLR